MKQPLKVFITGGSSGLGQALALEYAKNGAIITITGRNAERLARVSEAAKSTGAAECNHYTVDVRDKSALSALIKQTPIDIIIANAGISGGFASEDAQSFGREIFETNYFGVLNTIFPAVEVMTQQNHGKIAVISSIAGFVGLPSAPSYSASKAAVNSFCDAIRPELASKNIQLTLICPGFIKTPLVADNPFPMPMIMSAERAAQIIMKAIEAGKKTKFFPLPMAIATKLTSLLPAIIKDYALGHVKSKEPLV